MTKYTKINAGGFIDDQSPGIDAAWLNQVDQYLGYAGDSNVTSDGNGNLSVASINFPGKNLERLTNLPAVGRVHSLTA